MEKFIGTVNGVEYTNETDFNEAVAKALADNKGLNISSKKYIVDDEFEDDYENTEAYKPCISDFYPFENDFKLPTKEEIDEMFKPVAYKDILDFLNSIQDEITESVEEKNKWLAIAKDAESLIDDAKKQITILNKKIDEQLKRGDEAYEESEAFKKDIDYFVNLRNLIEEVTGVRNQYKKIDKSETCADETCLNECEDKCGDENPKSEDKANKTTTDNKALNDILDLLGGFSQYLEDVGFWKSFR